jgi:hypothetical protein
MTGTIEQQVVNPNEILRVLPSSTMPENNQEYPASSKLSESDLGDVPVIPTGTPQQNIPLTDQKDIKNSFLGKDVNSSDFLIEVVNKSGGIIGFGFGANNLN